MTRKTTNANDISPDLLTLQVKAAHVQNFFDRCRAGQQDPHAIRAFFAQVDCGVTPDEIGRSWFAACPPIALLGRRRQRIDDAAQLWTRFDVAPHNKPWGSQWQPFGAVLDAAPVAGQDGTDDDALLQGTLWRDVLRAQPWRVRSRKGLRDRDFVWVPGFGVEIDDVPDNARRFELQTQTVDDLARALGALPFCVVYSGSKSLHCFWRFDRPVQLRAPEHWARYSDKLRKLCRAIGADAAAIDVGREFRTPAYCDAQRAQPCLLYCPGATVDAAHWGAVVDQLYADRVGTEQPTWAPAVPAGRALRRTTAAPSGVLPSWARDKIQAKIDAAAAAGKGARHASIVQAAFYAGALYREQLDTDDAPAELIDALCAAAAQTGAARRYGHRLPQMLQQSFAKGARSTVYKRAQTITADAFNAPAQDNSCTPSGTDNSCTPSGTDDDNSCTEGLQGTDDDDSGTPAQVDSCTPEGTDDAERVDARTTPEGLQDDAAHCVPGRTGEILPQTPQTQTGSGFSSGRSVVCPVNFDLENAARAPLKKQVDSGTPAGQQDDNADAFGQVDPASVQGDDDAAALPKDNNCTPEGLQGTDDNSCTEGLQDDSCAPALDNSCTEGLQDDSCANEGTDDESCAPSDTDDTDDAARLRAQLHAFDRWLADAPGVDVRIAAGAQGAHGWTVTPAQDWGAFNWLCLPCRTGKTQATAALLREQVAQDPDLQVVYIVARRSLARAVAALLNFDCYLDDDSDNIRKTWTPENSRRLVCTVDSVHRLQRLGARPDVIILDEWTEILHALTLKTGPRSKMHDSFDLLSDWARTTAADGRQWICCDALAKPRALDALRELFFGAVLRVFCLPADVRPFTDKWFSAIDDRRLCARIWADLRAGRNLILYARTRRHAQRLFGFVHRCLQLSGEQDPARLIACYTAQNPLRVTVGDDNSGAWAQLRVVIYNGTISSGVSYPGAHFDTVYSCLGDWGLRVTDRNVAAGLREQLQAAFRARGASSIVFVLPSSGARVQAPTNENHTLTALQDLHAQGERCRSARDRLVARTGNADVYPLQADVADETRIALMRGAMMDAIEADKVDTDGTQAIEQIRAYLLDFGAQPGTVDSDDEPIEAFKGLNLYARGRHAANETLAQSIEFVRDHMPELKLHAAIDALLQGTQGASAAEQVDRRRAQLSAQGYATEPLTRQPSKIGLIAARCTGHESTLLRELLRETAPQGRIDPMRRNPDFDSVAYLWRLLLIVDPDFQAHVAQSVDVTATQVTRRDTCPEPLRVNLTALLQAPGTVDRINAARAERGMKPISTVQAAATEISRQLKSILGAAWVDCGREKGRQGERDGRIKAIDFRLLADMICSCEPTIRAILGAKIEPVDPSTVQLQPVDQNAAIGYSGELQRMDDAIGRAFLQSVANDDTDDTDDTEGRKDAAPAVVDAQTVPKWTTPKDAPQTVALLEQQLQPIPIAAIALQNLEFELERAWAAAIDRLDEVSAARFSHLQQRLGAQIEGLLPRLQLTDEQRQQLLQNKPARLREADRQFMTGWTKRDAAQVLRARQLTKELNPD